MTMNRMLMEESQNKLKLLFKSHNGIAQRARLNVNEQKTNYMVIGRREWRMPIHKNRSIHI